ncbi:COG1470 family protein [Flammeovirga kamogawensis]|uniref:Cadherin repeat domain-containing protein n=1 Tax=Flammeovirga kamogawensis TaxID=373891 RepID=A0ABX8H2F2_9BACT|nr:hypothetical protein [Flammeovirga kamogawensis]MBB6462374.1 hypothetical protein [Flammeovirga kamogawensis]QWG09487.1 hypothetical protein KM029_23050 [Flammeovirga kamogawensis]TRX65003.1 hypothetical protein EO216_20950 [Flammeovirga kamogawensis]
MKQLLYTAFIGLLVTIAGCQKNDPINTVGSEYMDSLSYASNIFYPLETMDSDAPQYDNKFGVHFHLDNFYSDDPADSTLYENASIDKETGVISIIDASRLDLDKAYYADVAAFTVSGKRLFSKVWTMGVTNVEGELFYSYPAPSYERNFEGEVAHLDSTGFAENVEMGTFQLLEAPRGFEIDEENGHILKTGYVEVGKYPLTVQANTTAGSTIKKDIVMVNIYGAPVLTYQPSFFKIQGNYDITATPTELDFLDGAVFSIKDNSGLSGISIDQNAVITLPENHNNAIGEYTVTVIAVVDNQSFEFEEAIKIEIVEKISPEITFAENKVTLSPWTPYTLTPELFSLPRNTSVALETVLPTGMTFDATSGIISIAEDQEFADATYAITMVATTPEGDVRLENLVQVVIEKVEEIVYQNNFEGTVWDDAIIRQTVLLQGGDPSSVPRLGMNADFNYSRLQLNRDKDADKNFVDYERIAYNSISLDIYNVKEAIVGFKNGINKNLDETQNYLSLNYSNNYDGATPHSATWVKDTNAVICKTECSVNADNPNKNWFNDPSQFSVSETSIPAEFIQGNKLNISWNFHKNQITDEKARTGHSFALADIVIKTYRKYDAIIE